MSYTYKSKTYDSLFTLAKDMYLFSDEMAKELRSENLVSFLKEKDNEKYEKIKKLYLLSIPDDVFVFKASYILNPYMSLRIKGFCFDSYEALGKTMLAYGPGLDPVLLELVRYQLISEQMLSSDYAKDHIDIYNQVLELENLSDSSLAYFSLGYFLSKKTTIVFNGVEYKDIYNLTYFLCKKEKDLGTLGSYLAFSPLLEAYSKYSTEEEGINNYLHLCQELDKSEKTFAEFLDKKRKGLTPTLNSK
jgi:L-rhamnose mutarotase